MQKLVPELLLVGWISNFGMVHCAYLKTVVITKFYVIEQLG